MGIPATNHSWNLPQSLCQSSAHSNYLSKSLQLLLSSAKAITHHDVGQAVETRSQLSDNYFLLCQRFFSRHSQLGVFRSHVTSSLSDRISVYYKEIITTLSMPLKKELWVAAQMSCSEHIYAFPCAPHLMFFAALYDLYVSSHCPTICSTWLQMSFCFLFFSFWNMCRIRENIWALRDNSFSANVEIWDTISQMWIAFWIFNLLKTCW